MGNLGRALRSGCLPTERHREMTMDLPSPPISPAWDEETRLTALRDYGILDTPREQDFDDLVQLAAQICGAPISVINLIEDTRQWFKSEIGLGISETPVDVSICARILLQPGLTVVPDLTQDARFDCNPLVTGDPKLRSYAGVVLETPDGFPLGTLCVLDYKPRGLTDQQAFALKTLARQVMSQIELRRALAEKVRTEEQQVLLIRELHHRVKNTLATVQAMMGSTARAAKSLDEFHETFTGRIDAMAKTHTLLIERHQSASIREILRQELAAHDDATGSRIKLHGPEVGLPADHAVALGMAVHELATNAAKYGSLSKAEGSLGITWQVVTEQGDCRLRWEWIERHGPPVTPPQHKGFGSRLLQRVLTTQLSANLDIDYHPDGLRVRMEFPLLERPAADIATGGIASS